MKLKASFLLGAVCASGTLSAAESDTLEHVLVTIPLHESTIETAFPIDVLTGDALAREAAATLGETLEALPGVHNASFGPGVGQPVIRGLSGPRVMSLQNGTRSADVSAISADHAVAVEALLADSIEVLRGPATLLYGGGAIGGVVNVVDGRIPTRLVEETELGAAWRYTGANNGQSGVFRVDTRVGNVGLHADWLVRDSDNVDVADGAGTDGADTLFNTGARATSGTLGSSFHFDGGFFGLAVNWSDNNYGLPEGSHAHGGHDEHAEDHADEEAHADDHDMHEEGEHHEGEEHGEEDIRLDVKQTRYDAVMHLHAPMQGVEVLRGFVTVTNYEHSELEGPELGTVYASDSVELRLEALHNEFSGLHGLIGLQASDTEFSAVGSESFVPRTDIRRSGIFLLEDWHAGAFQLEAGLRLDRDELSPAGGIAPQRDFTALSASLGLIYELTPAWHLSSSISRAERAPAVEELYSNFGNTDPDMWVTHAATAAIELGNTELDTEAGVNWDIGLTLHEGAHRASLSFYVNDFQRFINLANTGMEGAETPVRVYEQDGARFVGFEFDGDWSLGTVADGNLSLQTNLDWVRAELDAGGDVPRLPPLTGTLGIAWSDSDAEYYTRVTVADDQDRPGENEEATRSWSRWDLGGEWRLNAFGADAVLSLAMRNITDEEIRLSTSWLREYAPEPGRSLNLGIRLSL